MWIAGLEESYTYTGKAIKPEIHVYDHKRKLALNQDYSISYKNNTNAGEAQIIVTGKGNYTGSITVIETITDAKSDKLLEKMKFSAVKAQTYTGEEVTLEKKDLTITYKEGKETRTVTFKIEAKNIEKR